MATYIVTYDLHKSGQNYECLSKKLKAYGTYFHIQGSVWIIVTSSTAKEVRDNLKPCLDGNDKLLVVKSANVGAWFGYNHSDSKWLNDNL